MAYTGLVFFTGRRGRPSAGKLMSTYRIPIMGEKMRSNKVIVAGSRQFYDYKYVRATLDEKLRGAGATEIVSGHARGVDAAGEMYAKEVGIPLKIFPAMWDKYGKSAGYRRNREMAKYADMLIAFYNGSNGTGNMIQEMRKLGKPVVVVPIC